MNKSLAIVCLISLLFGQLFAQHGLTSCDDANECASQTINVGTSLAYWYVQINRV